ncbi:MAG: helix-turn-helix domain-containing protein [Cyclobacteriaceae bacterium]
MEVICLEEQAFFDLVERVVEHLGIQNQEEDWKWVSEEKAMALLGVSSKTTMQELRNNREIEFSQPRKKLISYNRDSIDEYLEKHAKKTF